MPRAPQNLYVGTNRYVAALDPRTGEEQWRTKLPRGTGGTPVDIIIKGRHLYVGCFGYAYCLDKRSGAIVWENGLPKMGFYATLLAMEGADGSTSRSGVVAAHHLAQQRRAASAGTTTAAST